MICAHCNTDTVTWRGPYSMLTHTECSTCGGINCQQVDEDEPEDDAERLEGEG